MIAAVSDAVDLSGLTTSILTVKVAAEQKGRGFLLKSFNQTFTRDEAVSNGEVKVRWNVSVKACNPECP